MSYEWAQVLQVAVVLRLSFQRRFPLPMSASFPLPGLAPEPETLGAVVPASESSALRSSGTLSKSPAPVMSHTTASASSASLNSKQSGSGNVSKRRNLRGSVISVAEGQVAHPLVTHAPDIAESVKFIRLGYLEQLLHDDAPFPRRQELPREAFRELDANCMLVSISHAWFWL